MIHRCSTYDPLSNLLRLFLVLKPYTHIPVDKHSTTTFVDENIAATDVAVQDIGVVVSLTMAYEYPLVNCKRRVEIKTFTFQRM